MILLSCLNCCHNPLQTDSLGPAVGYCTEHRTVLLSPSQLTCGRQFRKDLGAESAAKQRTLHERRFSPEMIAKLNESTRPVNGGHTSASKADLHELASDHVAEAVLDYGRLESKIASLAQLRYLSGVRPEMAMLSLGRVYVRRCLDRGGRWTSGMHLFWWTRRRVLENPEIELADLRVESTAPLSRQVALAQWSIIMMRLLFISDVGFYAGSSDRKMGRLARFAELAAEQTGELSPKRLLGWLKRDGTRLLNQALSEERYEKLSATLRNDEPMG